MDKCSISQTHAGGNVRFIGKGVIKETVFTFPSHIVEAYPYFGFEILFGFLPNSRNHFHTILSICYYLPEEREWLDSFVLKTEMN